MFQIPQRQYWPTVGDKAQQKGKSDQDMTDARANHRAAADQQALQNTSQQPAFTLPTQTFISQMAQPQIPQQAQTPRIIQILNQPLQQLQTPMQNLVQQVNQMLAQANIPLPGFMEKTLNQAFSFFFGNSKESGKDDTAEREKRDRNDDVLPDIFGEITFGLNQKVEQKPNTGLGSGSK